MIKTFVKKPVEVQAVQWDGNNYDEICKFIGVNPPIIYGNSGLYLVIETLEGDHYALPGDWIICGIKGEIYPCKPDIFEQTYEEVKP